MFTKHTFWHRKAASTSFALFSKKRRVVSGKKINDVMTIVYILLNISGVSDFLSASKKSKV